MNEQYHSPKHPEAQVLHNTALTIDAHQDIYPPNHIGEPAEDENYRYAVVGEIGLGAVADGIDLALIRATNKKSNIAEMFVVGLRKNDQGNREVAGGWESIPADQPVVIGRKSSKDTDDSKITGKNLFGVEFPSGVSRKHVTLELSASGQLTVADTSTNKSRVTGNVISDKDQQPVENLPSSGLIDRVPAAEEIAQLRKNEVAQKRNEILHEVEKLEDRMKGIESGLKDEAQGHALWQYASGTINKAEAQRAGNGQESYNEEQKAGEGWRKMSAGTRAVAPEYTALMQRKADLLGDL